MRPLVNFARWRGIIDKEVERDIPRTHLTECEDFEVDNILGTLRVAKGAGLKFAPNYPNALPGMIDYDVVRDDNSRIQYIRSDASELTVRRKNAGLWGSATTENGSTIGSTFDTFNPNERNGDSFSGVGIGANNIPFWRGYINRNRFWDGTVYQESINDYKFLKEELEPAQQAGVDVAKITDKGSSGVATGSTNFPATSIWQFVITLVYDGFQESPLFASDDGTIGIDQLDQVTVGASDNSIYLELVAKKDISPRVTAINIYMREVKFSTESRWGVFGNWIPFEWRLVRTIYTDNTKISSRQYDSPTAYNPAAISKWREYATDTTYWEAVTDQNVSAVQRIYITYDEYTASSPRAALLGYPDTNRTMPHYVVGTIFKDVRYVAGAQYPRISMGPSGLGPVEIDWSAEDFLPNVVYFSPPSEPNNLPISNFIVLNEPVTAIGAGNNELLIWSENNLSVYNVDRTLKNEWSRDGCVSHNSVASATGRVFWAGKTRINMYDRFYPEDISTYKIQQLYNGISLENKRNSFGVIDSESKEYVLSIPNFGILRYNYDTKEWTVRRAGTYLSLVEGAENEIVGVGVQGTARYIVDYDTGYLWITQGYTCTAKTKKFAGTNLDGVIKSFLMGYMSYVSYGTITINVYADNKLVHTDTVAANDTETTPLGNIRQFNFGGSNGETVQLEIKITTNNTFLGESYIDFVKIFGDIHEDVGDIY